MITFDRYALRQCRLATIGEIKGARKEAVEIWTTEEKFALRKK